MSDLIRSALGRFFLLASILFTWMGSAHAQINTVCVDSNRIDPYFQCNDSRFQPVCGCNQKTYRNDCVSYRNYGVNWLASEGVCQQDYFFWSFFPNITSTSFTFYLQFYDRGNITVEIRDSFGKLMYQLNKGPLSYLEQTIQVGGLRSGVYFIMVYSASHGKYEYKRFIKI